VIPQSYAREEAACREFMADMRGFSFLCPQPVAS
jgi:hypothetical protein